MQHNKPKYRKFSDLLVHPPQVIKNVFGNLVWDVNTNSNVIYLTFDDGPIPIITEKIIDILNVFNAKATFFCVGENVKRYPKIYKSILDNGHATGNHTFSHMSGLKAGTDEYLENIYKASKLIDSKLFRPPHGRLKFSQQQELQNNYKIVLWDVLSYDFDKKISGESCYQNVKHFARPGSVVVFHDNIKAERNMFYSLTKTLTYFSQLGFKFESLNTNILKKEAVKTVPLSRRFPILTSLF